MLGFSHFYVGRDHAGAENLYDPEKAVKTVKKYSKNLELRVLQVVVGIFALIVITMLLKMNVDIAVL